MLPKTITPDCCIVSPVCIAGKTISFTHRSQTARNKGDLNALRLNKGDLNDPAAKDKGGCNGSAAKNNGGLNT